MRTRSETRTGRRARRDGFEATANRNALAAAAMMDELVRAGVRDVCVSPGSRNAPLVLAAEANADLGVHVHVDERCGSFYALGLARAARRPVALVCTSGSAAAHWHPAVIEAFETGVPLILLTADRPPELRDVGAPQTTQQHGLYGEHVLRFQAIGLPRPTADWMRWLRGRVCRLVEIAQGPPAGPVHVDVHFDEPLSAARIDGDVPDALVAGDPVAAFGRPDGRPFAPWAPAELRPSGAALEELAELARSRPRGAIVVGPLDANDEERAAIAFLARATGLPLLADPLSGLRRPAPEGVATIGSYDAFLRDGDVAAALRPEWILRLGRMPTSKALTQWMGRHRDARLVVVDQDGRREDPNHAGALFVRARTAATCGVLGTAVRDAGATADPGPADARAAWTARWRAADAAAAEALAAGCGDESAPDHFEGGIVDLLAELLPADATILAASSMPVRELDAFLRPDGRPLRVLSNRGVNGIDGLVSTAFGVDAGADGPMVALLGDLATLHDVGGFAAVPRLGRGGTILVINNGGGGIFSYLPLARTGANVDDLFATQHDLGFRGAAQMFGLEYLAPATTAELRRHLEDTRAEDARLIEIVVDRDASVAHHRVLWAAGAAAAVAALGLDGDEGADA